MLNMILHFKFLKQSAFLLPLLLFGCKSTHQIATIDTGYTIVRDADLSKDAETESIITPYRKKMEETMNVIVGHTDEAMSKSRPESKLGNLISDVILDKATAQSKLPVDFAIQNYGGIRIPTLGAGDIRKGLMYEIMPFDNEIVIVRIKGIYVLKLMESIASDGGVPVSRGIQMTIIDKKIGSLLINGAVVDENKEYYIAVNDFMANGGDGYEVLSQGEQIHTGSLVRDALTEHFLYMQSQGKSVTAKIERRIAD